MISGGSNSGLEAWMTWTITVLFSHGYAKMILRFFTVFIWLEGIEEWMHELHIREKRKGRRERSFLLNYCKSSQKMLRLVFKINPNRHLLLCRRPGSVSHRKFHLCRKRSQAKWKVSRQEANARGMAALLIEFADVGFVFTGARRC